MNIKRNETGWRIWRRWTASCVVGWFLGFLMGFIFAGSFDGIVESGPVQSAAGYMVLGLFVGAGVGYMQWRLLRQHFTGVASWIAASAIGMGIAGGVGYSAAVLVFGYSEGLEGLGSIPAVLGWTLTAAFGGLIAGLLQRRILEQHRVEPRSWVLGSTLGWALSFAAFGTTAVVSDRVIKPVIPGVEGIDLLVALIIGGIVLGVVTATVASKMMGNPHPRSFEKPAHV